MNKFITHCTSLRTRYQRKEKKTELLASANARSRFDDSDSSFDFREVKVGKYQKFKMLSILTNIMVDRYCRHVVRHKDPRLSSPPPLIFRRMKKL